jgi:IclR family transcriptional regulator, KDG regulon repressor
VPAVQSALAILEFLRSVDNEPMTLSAIARGAGLNVSTCFNILKTLEDGLVVAYEPGSKTYRLGLRLAEFGRLVDGRSQALPFVLEEARRVTDVAELGCFVMALIDDHFVVLDKVESRHPIRVTIDRGATFPLTGAVAAKAWFAWSPREVVDDLMAKHRLPHRTDRSITDARAFRREMATTRERGYSTSLGEYYRGHNAVAAPVFGPGGFPQFLLVVVGPEGELVGATMAKVGEETRAAAERATKRIGGKPPE